MCGVVDGGISPGYGYEAGQCGVGDIFGWFVTTGAARTPGGGRAAGGAVHEHLTELARRAAGRAPRSPRARLAQRQPLRARRPRAVGAVRRADAATRRRDVYRALIEATAFGARDHRRHLRRRRRAGPRFIAPAG